MSIKRSPAILARIGWSLVLAVALTGLLFFFLNAGAARAGEKVKGCLEAAGLSAYILDARGEVVPQKGGLVYPLDDLLLEGTGVITKTGPDYAIVGQPMSYTVAASATDNPTEVIQDELPPDVEPDTVQVEPSPPCAVNPPAPSVVVECPTGGEAIEVTIVVTPTRTGPMQNTARVGSTGETVIVSTEVVSDPFRETTTSNGRIDIKYVPGPESSPCDKIVLIQVIKRRAFDGGGNELDPPPTPAEWNLPDADKKKNDLTPGGYRVDSPDTERDPYMNGDSADRTEGIDHGNIGQRNGGNTPATASDNPNHPDWAYPANVEKIVLEFETCAFCAEGHDKGQYFGCVTWTWTREKGKPAASQVTGSSVGEPSQAFKDAVKKWDDNRDNFELPTPN